MNIDLQAIILFQLHADLLDSQNHLNHTKIRKHTNTSKQPKPLLPSYTFPEYRGSLRSG